MAKQAPVFNTITFNKDELRDKIYACWVGKNIGGTMGTPYECAQQINDIQGFVTEKGVVLPNDDLDLQLVWLRAMDEQGPEHVNSKVLAEYWTSFIGPSWNEYGVGQGNLRAGIIPPMSGELYNDEWRHSNGAWIRTEIWACTHPGYPEGAIKYAFEDACVDHGFGEGSYATIFVAAMQSAAFIFNDLRTLINIGLSKIPEDCRTARAIKIVLNNYDKGIDWKTTREELVEDSKDIGWFQAPMNVAFAVLGMLYGECDFKKSMILAINCGDDTDCTGATVGATLGIMYGMKGIPADWREHIGDDIVTISIIKGHGYFPRTSIELTDCVMSMLNATMRTPNPIVATHGPLFRLTDGASDFGSLVPEDFMGREFAERMFSRSRYSFTVESVYANILVEYEKEPIIEANGELKMKITCELTPNMAEQKHFQLRFFLPEGWRAEGRKHIHASMPSGSHGGHIWSLDHGYSTTEITIVANENVEASNRGVIEITSPERPNPILVPLVILG